MNEGFFADLVQDLYVKELKAYKAPPTVRIFQHRPGSVYPPSLTHTF